MLKIRILKESKETGLNPVQQHNLNFLLNNSQASTDLGDLDIYDKDDFINLVKKIAILGKVKIASYITGRSYGKLFKLANGWILKMFSDAVEPEEDIDWYRQSLEKLFSGKATSESLPIFDSGESKVVGKTIYWGVMPEFVPLDKWLEQTGRDPLYATSEIDVLSHFYEDKHSADLLDFQKWLKKEMKGSSFRFQTKSLMFDKIIGEESDSTLTKEEMAAFLKALDELVVGSGSSPKDVYTRNIGKTQQSRPDKPVFVIFDN